ncbi:DUF5994 family protein [Amycolatopsis sp. M39]|uniref:DUF5994 family protein n=1 Tax=Amycolatopsis sp. M39 TaxID=1825094 RepID=UPI00350ECDC6
MMPKPHPRTSTSLAQPCPGAPPAPRSEPGSAGHVDDGRRPRPREVPAELPGPGEARTARLDCLTTAAHPVSGRDSAPRRAEIGGQPVRLDGPPGLGGQVWSRTGPEPHRGTLLFVPPDASDTAGHRAALTLASRRGATGRCSGILAAPAPRRTAGATGMPIGGCRP